MSDNAAVLVARSEGIGWLTLNRPTRGNSIDFQLVEELDAAAKDCAADQSVRCVVLSGSGRFFCAGGDLNLFNDAGAERSNLLAKLAAILHSALSSFARMRKPLLTLINGPAAGAGLSLSLCGDVVLAARSAYFTSAYTAIGLTPDGGMTWMLPRLIGVRRAQEMLLTNRSVTANEAQRMGLVTRVVSDESLAAEGAKLASKLAQSATEALGATRALILNSIQTSFEAQLSAEAHAIAAAGARPECAEGINAFLSKRLPIFDGK